MASTESTFLRELYADWTARMAANPEMGLAGMRAVFEEWHLPTLEPPGVTYECVSAGGVEAMWCTPAEARTDRAILYLHGGGFAVGSMHSHRKLAGHIAKAAGCPAIVTNYRLAPEYPFPAGIQDNVTVYRWLLERGIAASSIAVCGDSAGGNLSLTTSLMARDEGLPLPGAIAVLSPFCDLEVTGETMKSRADVDTLVNYEIASGMGAMLLGDGDRNIPLANPLLADLTGFPPLHIEVGGHECLLADSEQLARHAEQAGVLVTLSVVPEMQHVFPILAGRCPEADEAVGRIAAHIATHLT
jgi:monoterpene epsilon-lactone hydrolase